MDLGRKNQNESLKTMKQLSVHELHQWQQEAKPFQLIDVRERWEHDLCKLDHSILAPLTLLQFNPPDLDKNKPLVVYCHYGVRSIAGCTMLEQRGYSEVYNLSGGIDQYAQMVDLTMARY